MSKPLLSGQVVAGHGRHYVLLTQDQILYKCYPRSKRSDFVVGDWLDFSPTATNEGVIEHLHERQSLLYRSDNFKTKLFAANVSQVFVVVATEPSFTLDLLHRAVVAAQVANAEGVACNIILNKIDLLQKLALAREKLSIFHQLNVPIIETNANDPQLVCERLLPLLKDQTSLFLGQSGMGKSSLLNALIPDANATIKEISSVLDSGKHTTTFTRLYHLPMQTGSVIDSPGFQSFGLAHLNDHDLLRVFSEFHEHIPKCRFYNCKHLQEPSCGVRAAVESEHISLARYQLYVMLHEEQKVTQY